VSEEFGCTSIERNASVTPVEIIPVQGSLVLRARGSELLILTSYIIELKARSEPKEFASYFLSSALINRPARKLFEAWLRKDRGLWQRLYKTVNEMEVDSELKTQGSQDSQPAIAAAENLKPTAQVTEEKPRQEPAATKVSPKKAEAKPAKKATQDDEEAEPVKPSPKKVATKAEVKAPAKKKTVKKAEVKAPAKKKTAKKAEPKKKTASAKPKAAAAAKAKTAKKKTAKKK